MEPLDDKELNELLRRWEAPAAPSSLDRIVLRSRRSRWLWLINGTVRIPVPVAVAAALLFGVWVYTQQPATSNMPVPPIARVLKPAAVADAPALAGFQPVTTVEVQVIKESR